MAQNPGTQARQAPATTPSVVAPAVLHQGRAADPAPAGTDTAEAADSSGSRAVSADTNPVETASHQRQLRLIMRQCDRVLLVDYDVLAMEKWPDNAGIVAARWRRDLWFLVVVIAAVLFVGGMFGVLPAWLGGTGFGAFVTTLLLALPPVSRVFSSRPLHWELIQQRRQMLQDARRHVAHLEGSDGLAWQCERMAPFNPVLASHSFSKLREASEGHLLVRQLTERKYVRLYLFYMVEADKAYQRLQQAFLDSRQEGLEQGYMQSSIEEEVEEKAGTDLKPVASQVQTSVDDSANLTS